MLFFCRQVLFENRKVGDIGNNCLLLIDGTDIQIAKSYKKPFYSYKFKKSGFCYEVGLCIKTGNICWWAGPYLPGILNDEMIFKHGLAKLLEPGEKVEVDGGYWGSASELVKCPEVAEEEPNNVEMQQRVRSHQERVNKQFKNWAIFSNPYHHQLLEHQTVFGAIVVLTQLSFAENPLWQVDYDDY
jgi:hypothetical protein